MPHDFPGFPVVAWGCGVSYARFAKDSGVYVYCDCGGYLCCCACSLSDEWKHYSTDAMIAHLREHLASGHDVPEWTIPGLEADRADNDAFIAFMAAGGHYEDYCEGDASNPPHTGQP